MQHQQAKKPDKSHDTDSALNSVKREYMENFDGQYAGMPLYLEPVHSRSLQHQLLEEEEELQPTLEKESGQRAIQRQVEEDSEEEQEAINPKSVVATITPFQSKQPQRQLQEEKEELHTKLNRQNIRSASSLVTDHVKSLNGGGQPLPSPTKSFFESRFGRDFSNARIHSDTKSSETAKSIQAKAYTSGQNIVFGAGEYSPDGVRAVSRGRFWGRCQGEAVSRGRFGGVKGTVRRCQGDCQGDGSGRCQGDGSVSRGRFDRCQGDGSGDILSRFMSRGRLVISCQGDRFW